MVTGSDDGVEDLELVRLVEGLDPLARLLAADLLAAQGHVLVDDLDHLLLDGLEVFVCYRREGDVNGGGSVEVREFAKRDGSARGFWSRRGRDWPRGVGDCVPEKPSG